VYMIFAYSGIFEEPNPDGSFNYWWRTNVVPTGQVVTLIIMFLMLSLDRVIYFKRYTLARIIFYYASVVAYNGVFLFLVDLGARPLAQAFYFFKLSYFLATGYQIRAGNPLYVTGQLLMRNFSLTGKLVFEVYFFVPFLWLLRTLLDWALLPTTIEIFAWFKIQDISLNLYRNRAVNQSRSWLKRTRGQQRPIAPRLFQGASFFVGLGFILLLPFILFSSLNPFFTSATIATASFTMALESSLPLASSSSSSSSSTDAVKTAASLYARNLVDVTAVSNNAALDFATSRGFVFVPSDQSEPYLIRFGPDSNSRWAPPPPLAAQLTALLTNYSATNPPRIRHSLAVRGAAQQVYALSGAETISREQAALLADAIAERSNISMMLPRSLSEYYLFDTSGPGVPLVPVSEELGSTCVQLRFESNGSGSSAPWWRTFDCVSSDAQECGCVDDGDDGDGAGDVKGGTLFLAQLAKVQSLQLGGGTILALYGVILLSLHAAISRPFKDGRMKLIYLDMPYTLHLWQLLYDIFLSRENLELEAEELLHNALIDVYRDTHELKRWTGKRMFKTAEPWWVGDLSVDKWPSFRETSTEPYPNKYRNAATRAAQETGFGDAESIGSVRSSSAGGSSARKRR